MIGTQASGPRAIRVLVTGGRDYRDEDAVFRALYAIEAQALGPIEIIEGGQRFYRNGRIVGGADYWAWCWAQRTGAVCHTFFAKWDAEGVRAGPIRNSRMLSEGRPDICVPFPGGAGTADMVAKATRAGIQIWMTTDS